MILGVDLGFVQTKAVTEAWQRKFNSLTKLADPTAVKILDDSDGFSIRHAGEEWRVGAKGSYDFTAERSTQGTSLPKLLAVLGLLQEDAPLPRCHIIDYLLTGLPIEEYNAYRQTLKEGLQGQTFIYSFNGKMRNTIVHDVLVIPQSAGAFYDLILDDHGGLADEALASENVLTIDIGGRTTDCCIMEGGKYSQESFTLFRGVWKLQDHLRKLVHRQFKYLLKPYEVDAVARTGAIKLGGDVIPCEMLVQEAIAHTFPEIRDELTLHIDDFRRFAGVLLTGGGAYLYKELFYNLFDKLGVPTVLMNDAEFSNANGYYKYALLKLNS